MTTSEIRTMKAFIAFVAPVLSFAAALTALLGPSRKPDQIGIASLTVFGWAAAAFALIGLVLTLYNAKAQRNALRRAENELASMRKTAQSEFEDGINLILDILRFAALMPYTTNMNPHGARKLPSDRSSEIDLRSERTLADLAKLKLDPSARLRSPFIPSAVPFSPSTKSAMTILREQSSKAIAILENALQIYSARAVDAGVIETASVLSRDPFLKRLTILDAKWEARSAIEEDASDPEIVNLYFLDDTTNPSPRKYLELLDRVDRLQAALDKRRD
jgi:hypothetical protein